MSRPRLLDLFCGAGGAGMGYHRAGFEVTGVDIEPQPRYPFEFHQADALTFPLEGFDLIHASPPCQAFTVMHNLGWPGKDHPDLIAATRRRLMANGRPWVIENVPGAPMPASFVLCGSMFGLPIRRHRQFETSPFLLVPPHRHRVGEHPILVTSGRLTKRRRVERPWQVNAVASVAGKAIGIDWMTRDGLSNAIPPAYTEWIGTRLLEAMERAA
jgi:DNA (cytosine-5)-methyltransferase 1